MLTCKPMFPWGYSYSVCNVLWGWSEILVCYLLVDLKKRGGHELHGREPLDE